MYGMRECYHICYHAYARCQQWQSNNDHESIKEKHKATKAASSVRSSTMFLGLSRSLMGVTAIYPVISPPFSSYNL